MTERTFDRLPEFDERSRAYPVRTLVAAKKPRSYTWRCDAFLDQGREGACVGFSCAHEIAARPTVLPVTDALARNIYKLAQTLDQWPGENYEGTSVLAGAKALHQSGYLDEYRWAFGLDDVVLALGYSGPVILGVDWYSGMYAPDADGYLRVEGSVVGGHAILAKGVSLKRRAVLLHNSWGRDWGNNGSAWLSFDGLARLLAARGEACVPVRRATPALT